MLRKVYPKTIYCFFVFIALICSFVNSAWARPEYAVRHNINRCTACHYSPIGGGARNLNGKQYGSKNLGLSPFAKQEYFSADIRMAHYDPSDTSVRSGMGLMAGLFSLNVPISPQDDSLILSYTHNIGGWSSTDSAFFRWKNSSDTETQWAPQYIMVGRFHAPFGPLTDEHRTYTQLQTKNTWNMDFEMGAVLSANPIDAIHYDIAIVNGEKAGGSVPGAGRATLWGTIINLRMLPQSWPMQIGASYSHHERRSTSSAPEASTIYSVIAFDRLTKQKMRGSLTLQYTLAKNWNSSIPDSFFADANYKSAIANDDSEGVYAQLVYDLTEHFSLVYKFDRLVLDKAFPSDYYIRNGFGFRHLVAPNGYFSARYELAEASHPSEKNSHAMGAAEGFWLLLQISI